MAINSDRAFDVLEDGIVFRDNDGNAEFYISTGTGDPTGSPAPENSWYFDKTNKLIYYKHGPGNNDWRQLRADDIAFDNTIAQFNNSPDTVQKALEEAKGSRFQYAQFQLLGNANFDQYLFSWSDFGSIDRESGNPSNGYQFSDSAPITAAFTGTVDQATASIRGVAQSTGTPAATCTALFELWKVGFSGEGTKLGDIEFAIDSSTYTVGTFWNSSVQTEFAEEQTQNVSVTAGDLLGLKFKRQTGASNIVAVRNTTVVLEIIGAT